MEELAVKYLSFNYRWDITDVIDEKFKDDRYAYKVCVEAFSEATRAAYQFLEFSHEQTIDFDPKREKLIKKRQHTLLARHEFLEEILDLH